MGIALQWKEFSVPVTRLDIALRALLGANYDGLVCGDEDFMVMFKEEPTEEEAATLTTYWSSVQAGQFAPSLREYLSGKINEASAFGRAVILDAAVENVELGITQVGKTRSVANYCANVQRYLESGSLYAAIAELDDLMAAEIPAALSPFITLARLQAYKARIEDYLS